MRPRKLVVYLQVLSVLLLSSAPVRSQDLERAEKALGIIGKFANDICNKPDLRGKSSSVEVEGKAKAEASKLIKQLADLQIEGAAKLNNTEYEGLIQKDLLPALQESTKCQERIFNDLKDRFLPMPISQAPAPFPAALVGTWIAENSNSGRFAQFTFRSDGTYDWNVKGRFSQAPGEPTFDIDREESGIVKVEREKLTLYPTSGHSIVNGRQVERVEVQYSWEVRQNNDGSGALLMSHGGEPSAVFVRRRINTPPTTRIPSQLCDTWILEDQRGYAKLTIRPDGTYDRIGVASFSDGDVGK